MAITLLGQITSSDILGALDLKYRSVCSKLLQSHLTFCDLMDCSPPVPSVHGILQARILEWVAISSSKGSSQPRDCISQRLLHWQANSLSHGKPLNKGNIKVRLDFE